MSERTESPRRYFHRHVLKAVTGGLAIVAACFAIAASGTPGDVTAQGLGDPDPDIDAMNKAFRDYMEAVKGMQKEFLSAEAFGLDDAHAVGAYDLISAFLHSSNRNNMSSSGTGARGRPRFAGFDHPTEGDVTLMGEPIAGVEPRCGMVFQNYALFPWLSVRGNIAFGPRLRGQASAERVSELIRIVGIEGFDDHYPAQLSGGMKQRVALARTLANDPEVLLCDEPFAALDAMTRQVLQEELSRLAAATGKTVVFITHSIDEALLLSDRIVVMTARPGRIKASLENPLPRPRSAAQQLTPEYLALKREIWESVQEEVLASIAAPA